MVGGGTRAITNMAIGVSFIIIVPENFVLYMHFMYYKTFSDVFQEGHFPWKSLVFYSFNFKALCNNREKFSINIVE